MPLLESPSSGAELHGVNAARLLVQIGSAEPDSGRRGTVATTDDIQVTGTLGRLPYEWEHPERSRDRLHTSSGDSDSAVEVGKQLFAALFSGPLSRCWAKAVEQARQFGGLELVIDSPDVAVHGLPWELLCDPVVIQGHVALLEGWSIVRSRSRADRPLTPAAVDETNLQALVLASVSADGPVVTESTVSVPFPHASVDVTTPLSADALLAAVSTQHRDLVHIAATGERSRGRQQLLVGDPSFGHLVSSDSLLEAFRTQPDLPRLCVLASCDTDLLAAELAAELPNVIGMRGRISDTSCLAFVRGLYDALATGVSLDRAVAAGRAHQARAGAVTSNDEWALPVAFVSDHAPLITTSNAAVTRKVYRLPEVVAMAPEVTGQEPIGILLDMKQANLAALRQRWGAKIDDAPSIVREQFTSLEREVNALTEESGSTL